jgi:hypothetical protein
MSIFAFAKNVQQMICRMAPAISLGGLPKHEESQCQALSIEEECSTRHICEGWPAVRH